MLVDPPECLEVHTIFSSSPRIHGRPHNKIHMLPPPRKPVLSYVIHLTSSTGTLEGEFVLGPCHTPQPPGERKGGIGSYEITHLTVCRPTLVGRAVYPMPSSGCLGGFRILYRVYCDFKYVASAPPSPFHAPCFRRCNFHLPRGRSSIIDPFSILLDM